MTWRLHRQIALSMTLCCMSVSGHGQAARKQSEASFDTLAREASQAKDANHLAKAAALYREALKLKTNWEEGWWSLGTVDYDQGDFAEAARSFQRVISEDPKQGTARLMLGLCEFELGHDGDALKDIEEAKTGVIATDPQLREVMFYHEGVLLRRAGKFEGASEALTKLCKNAPGSDDVVQELGMVALRRNEKLLAGDDPRVVATVRQLGQAECLLTEKRFDEALALASATVKTYPDIPSIHYAYGRLLLVEQDTDAAIGEFEREIANDPNDVFSRLQIAAVKYRVDSAAGVPYAEEAVKLDPRLPFGHYLLGLLLIDTKAYEQAVPQLEIARQSFPNEARVYFALGTAYSRVGRQHDAAQARATFLRLNKQAVGTGTDGESGTGLLP